MRTEQQMLGLLIRTGREDNRIRGAYLTGSRANPNAPRDIFQDYDVVYVVHETASFIADSGWIDRFGERLYMQYPESGPYAVADTESCFGWLMQFADGVRLDLHVCTQEHLPQGLANDGMYRVLLDKDGCLPAADLESDAAFWVRPFTEAQFQYTCNEFWWCTNNVAKGLWRGEVTYALDMLNHSIRPMLTRLLEWKVGLETQFAVSVGKSAKYMNRWLPDALWQRYLCTYCGARTEDIWQAVFSMFDLMDEIAGEIGAATGYRVDALEAANGRSYLEQVRTLAKDATDVCECNQ